MATDPELTAKNVATLNQQFYDGSPWTYFQQRLAHLVLVASNDERFRKLLAAGATTGGITLKIESDPEPETYPTPSQAFTAVEAEVLLHHAAETLMRFVHAHAEPDPCPPVRMARLRGFGAFKDWVRTRVANASSDDLAELCGRIFACDPDSPEDLASHVRYVRVLARHFLDSDSYNAAKHGMALRGGSERIELEVGDWNLMSQQGMRVSWLAHMPHGDDQTSPRWTQATRLLSPDATIALIFTASNLMRSIWIRGRADHLGEPWDEVFRPHSLDDFLSDLGIRHHVLVDTYLRLAPEGENETLVVRTAHLDPQHDSPAD